MWRSAMGLPGGKSGLVSLKVPSARAAGSAITRLAKARAHDARLRAAVHLTLPVEAEAVLIEVLR
jgi:hypothetical protein